MLEEFFASDAEVALEEHFVELALRVVEVFASAEEGNVVGQRLA